MKLKTWIFICALISLTSSYSQTFEEVIEVENTGKSELYERSLRWFVINIKDSNFSIKLQDSIKGEVFGKLFFETPVFKIKGGMNDMVSVLDRYVYYKGRANISVQILSREGRYKYIINLTDWEKIQQIKTQNYARMEKTLIEQDEEITSYIDTYIKEALIEEIKKHMSTKSNFEEDDW